MGLQMSWKDSQRMLTLRLAEGSKMLPPLRRNIEVKLNSSVIAVAGADHCERITIQNNKTCSTETVSASALLIYAGAVPRTDWLAGVVERDAQGYLISGQHLMLEGRRPTG